MQFPSFYFLFSSYVMWHIIWQDDRIFNKTFYLAINVPRRLIDHLLHLALLNGVNIGRLLVDETLYRFLRRLFVA